MLSRVCLIGSEMSKIPSFRMVECLTLEKTIISKRGKK